MNSVVPVGIIGAGFAGLAHIEALRRIPLAEVAAVDTTDPGKVPFLKDHLRIPRVYTDWRELVADQTLLAVHNCTPNHLHYEVNRAILLAGKAVLSEKPLTVSAAEAAELAALSRERRLVNAVGFNYRFYPMVQHARAMVAAGDLGPVRFAQGHYLQDWLLSETDFNWRLDPAIGGTSQVFADIGSHWCDTAEHVLGRRITRVFADLATLLPERLAPAGASTPRGRRVPITLEDYASLLVEFEGGIRGAFTVSQVAAGHKNDLVLELAGATGSLRWAQEAPELLWLGRRNQPNATLLRDPSLLAPSARPLSHYPPGHNEGWPDALRNQLEAFYSFLHEGGDPLTDTPLFGTFTDGLHEMRILEAVLSSARAGAWVAVAA